MICRVEFAAAAREAIAHLPPSVKQRVKECLRFLSANPHGGEPLKRELTGLWKFRTGQFRIVYHLESNRRTIVVVAVGHRRDVYSSIPQEALRFFCRERPVPKKMPKFGTYRFRIKRSLARSEISLD